MKRMQILVSILPIGYFSILAGCASSPVRMYAGPARPPEEVAIIQADPALWRFSQWLQPPSKPCWAATGTTCLCCSVMYTRILVRPRKMASPLGRVPSYWSCKPGVWVRCWTPISCWIQFVVIAWWWLERVISLAGITPSASFRAAILWFSSVWFYNWGDSGLC